MHRLHPPLIFTLCLSALLATLALCSMSAHAQTLSYTQAQQALQAGQYSAAFNAFQTLASQGDAASQFQLSLLYRTGKAVAPNGPLALQWLQRAAQGRYGEALSNLGGEYARGQALRQDKVKALALFLLAQTQGVDVAGTNAQTVARTLNAPQIEQAKALAQTCAQGSMRPCL